MAQGFVNSGINVPLPLAVVSGGTGVTTSTGTGSVVLNNNPTLISPKIDVINDTVFNLPVMVFNGVAGAVNVIAAISGPTGGATGFQFSGTDANVSAAYTTKGAGTHSFYNTLGSVSAPILILNGPSPNLVNSFIMSGALTANNPTINLQGTDTNISMTINAKGTGGVIIKGTGTNNNAPAGYVGELLTAANLAAAPIAYTNGTAKTLQTVTLTPGDWDVWGNIFWVATTTAQSGQVSLSLVNNTMADNSLITFVAGLATTTAMALVAPMRTFTVTSNTPVYLVGIISGTGTLSGSGGIYARRRS